jgi:hypothetical protein
LAQIDAVVCQLDERGKWPGMSKADILEAEVQVVSNCVARPRALPELLDARSLGPDRLLSSQFAETALSRH